MCFDKIKVDDIYDCLVLLLRKVWNFWLLMLSMIIGWIIDDLVMLVVKLGFDVCW